MKKIPIDDKLRGIVQRLVGCGFTLDQVAQVVEIPIRTLQRHCAAEIRNGAPKANAAVAMTLYRMAVAGDPPSATYFWCKTRMGWRETERHEVTGPEGAPLAVGAPTLTIIQESVAPAAMTDSDLALCAAEYDCRQRRH